MRKRLCLLVLCSHAGRSILQRVSISTSSSRLLTPSPSFVYLQPARSAVHSLVSRRQQVSKSSYKGKVHSLTAHRSRKDSSVPRGREYLVMAPLFLLSQASHPPSPNQHIKKSCTVSPRVAIRRATVCREAGILPHRPARPWKA